MLTSTNFNKLISYGSYALVTVTQNCKTITKPGTSGLLLNPHSSGGWDGAGEGKGSKFQARPSISTRAGVGMGMVACTCHSSYSRKHKIELRSRPAWQKARPYFQNDQRKKGWRCGLSLASSKHWVQIPILPKKKNSHNKKITRKCSSLLSKHFRNFETNIQSSQWLKKRK
jgi:hypothetical protein